MLTLQAAESAHVTTEQLDAKGIALTAKPGSLLAGLVATTFINYDPVVQNGEFYHDIGNMCSRTDSASTATGFSEHTARMEEISDLIAEKVNKHLFITRTVVAPFVDAYAGRLAAASEMIAGNPDNGVEVVINRQPGPLAEPSLVDSISRSHEVVYLQPALNCDLPEMDDNQIRAMMQTGSASVDVSINDYFASKETGWLASRFKTIFVKAPLGDPVPAGLDQLISGRNNVDTALMVFLITRRIWNNPPEGTNMAIAAYEDTMVTYRNQSAQRLCLELERLGRETQSGVLITGFEKNGTSQRIVVNSSLYKDFLKKGGTNELLLGNALSNERVSRVDDLLENKAKYESVWERHYAYNKSYYEQKRVLQLRESLVVEWEGLMREYTAEDFPIPERASSLAMVKRLAQKATTNDFDDVSALALSIACTARFYKTDAYAILNGIARARKANPQLSVQEAASISTNEYIYRWIGKQMTPVSAGKMQVFTAKDVQLA